MNETDLSIHARSAASAALAASIAMMFACVFSLVFGADVPEALLWGVWCAVVGFGGTYAITFFINLAKRGKRAP